MKEKTIPKLDKVNGKRAHKSSIEHSISSYHKLSYGKQH